MDRPSTRSLHFLSCLAAAIAALFTACGQSHAGDLDAGGDAGDTGTPQLATWSDPASGLTWQVPSSAFEGTWAHATQYCDGLVLDGHDDWRMPTIDELRSLIRGCPDTETGGACRETDACTGAGPTCYDGELCLGCATRAGPGVDGCFWPPEMGRECGWTWSSTPTDDTPDYYCFAELSIAHLSHDYELADVEHHAICVR